MSQTPLHSSMQLVAISDTFLDQGTTPVCWRKLHNRLRVGPIAHRHTFARIFSRYTAEMSRTMGRTSRTPVCPRADIWFLADICDRTIVFVCNKDNYSGYESWQPDTANTLAACALTWHRPTPRRHTSSMRSSSGAASPHRRGWACLCPKTLFSALCSR